MPPNTPEANKSIDNTGEPNEVPSVVNQKGAKLADITASAGVETQESQNELENLSRSLVEAIRALLQHSGVRKSEAAIREAVDLPHQTFGPKEAVNALINFGFKASFGGLKKNKLDKLVPLVFITKDSRAIVVTELDATKAVCLELTKGRLTTTDMERSAFEQQYSGYVIIAKKLSEEAVRELQGHWFFSAFRKSKWLYVQVMVAAMVSNFLGLTTAIFTMTVYDRIIPNGALESLFAISIGVIVALLFDFIIKGLRAKFLDRASQRADLDISRRLFDRILTLTASEKKSKTGALAGTVKEFETLREFFNSSTLVVLIDLPFVFFFIYVIYLVSGPLAYVPAVAVPLVIIMGLLIQPILSSLTRRTVNSGMDKQSVLVETLTGLETVNSTGSGRLMRRRYVEALDNQSTTGSKQRAIGSFIINFAASVQQYAQVAIIFLGVYLVTDGTITQGALIAAVILSGRTMGPLSQLANTMSRMNVALAAYRNLNNLIGAKSLSNRTSPISRPNFSGEIEFRNVTFKYADEDVPIIDNLSFKCPAGQKVALVGKMGSGKSTILRLIAGILEPQQGAILIDGIDVRQIDKSDLRNNVGVMLQETWLFSGSIRENIQLGYENYSDQHLLNICKVAGVDDFVGSHPQGYDLVIKERGEGLSGGQKQSINLARSILHDPAIILLDEPTSSMDQATEKETIAKLEHFCENKTMLLVTHRNPILSIVDRVILLEKGKVVADQTPEKFGIKKAG